MFPNASQVAINGGTFYEINTRDAYFDQPWGPNAHVNINVVGNVYPLYRIASTSAQETKALWRNSLLRSGQPNSFSRVEAWLEAMSHYLAPVSEKSFRTLRRHLDDIQSLSSFSRTLYEISNGCAIDRIVKRRIEMQLQGCAQMLEKIHRRVVALPLWWIFLIKFVYGETFAEWLTDGRDPELQDIENDLGKEIQLFGKCIKSMQCLEGWPWGPQMWCSLTAQISFSAGLSNFLKTSGPSWIRDIIVEELIILEPIKGSPWSVPLVFVETIEDIHGFVQAGSQNTISSPYIEARQYQLDDSATNAEVDENSLCDYLEHKRILEVTICIRAPAEMKQDRCPGCGRLRDMLSEESTWVRCACLMQYIQRLISQTPEDVSRCDVMEDEPVSVDEPEGRAANDTTQDEIPDPSFAPPSAFRRLKIETVHDPSIVREGSEAVDDTLDNLSESPLSAGFSERTRISSQPPSPQQEHVAPRDPWPLPTDFLKPIGSWSQPPSPQQEDVASRDDWSDSPLLTNFSEGTGTWAQPPDTQQEHVEGQLRQHLFVRFLTMQWRTRVSELEMKKRNLILVIGDSGVGKSSFINDLARKPLATVNPGLVGSTTIDYHEIYTADGGASLLKTFIDCPGYNHTRRTDRELNTVIRNFLAESPSLFPLDSKVMGIICLIDLSSPFRRRAEWHSIFTNPKLKCPKLLAVTNSQNSQVHTSALSTLPVIKNMVSNGAKIVPYAYRSRNYALPLLQSMFESDEPASHFTLRTFLDKVFLKELWPVASSIATWEYYHTF